MSSDRIQRGLYDRAHVEDADGEEVEVFGLVSVTVEEQTQFRPAGQETFRGSVEIEAGDGGIGAPEAVDQRVAEAIYAEYGIEVTDHDIRVIDPTAEEVDVL
jgi:hypothetical protein